MNNNRNTNVDIAHTLDVLGSFVCFLDPPATGLGDFQRGFFRVLDECVLGNGASCGNHRNPALAFPLLSTTTTSSTSSTVTLRFLAFSLNLRVLDIMVQVQGGYLAVDAWHVVTRKLHNSVSSRSIEP
jgi:hypothetical protein